MEKGNKAGLFPGEKYCCSSHHRYDCTMESFRSTSFRSGTKTVLQDLITLFLVDKETECLFDVSVA